MSSMMEDLTFLKMHLASSIRSICHFPNSTCYFAGVMTSTLAGSAFPPRMPCNLVAYLLSRAAIITTCLVFPYWLSFMLNDPLEVGWNTLDTLDTLSDAKCTNFDVFAFSTNNLAFALFVVPHTLMARRRVKEALGITDQPYERPLFAFMSPITFLLSISYWTPVSNCRRFDPAALSLGHVVISGSISVIAALYITAAMVTLPDHIFGTRRYKLGSDEKAEARLITSFPYNLVRHPAGAGFLWLLWSFPSYTVNHITLSIMWTLYVVPATLLLEERSLKGPQGEFGAAYDCYAQEVSAFVPGKSLLRIAR